ncbi:MAG: NACHT domain-containing protein [Oscillatoria sp. SIO1A7]|nr:NACHT domain-containing protein [Oscillatoria sp. SIO1A7]
MGEKQGKRDRGRILTEAGLQKINKAIAEEYRKQGTKRSYEKIAEKSQLNINTVEKILKRTGAADRRSIQDLFEAFGVHLEEADHISAKDRELQIQQPSPLVPIGDEIRWVGRQAQIAELIQRLRGDCRVLSILGITGIGKTSLAARLIADAEIRQQLPELRYVDFYQDSPQFEVVARRLLAENPASNPQLPQDERALVEAMVAKLQSRPYLLVIDMLEEVLEADGEGGHRFREQVFAKFLERALLAESMPSRIVLTSQDRLPVLAEGRFPQRCCPVPLGGLEESEVRSLFEEWEVRVEDGEDWQHLQSMARAYEGHPLALKVIAGEIREDYRGNIRAYWHDYGNEIEEVERLRADSVERSREDKPRIDRHSFRLKDLVKKRVEKTLARLQRAYPLACLMLCMGATYRRPVERRAWLLQLADYSQEEQELAFEILQRRFFLEAEQPGDKNLYRPHNLIRRAALDLLPQIEEEVLPQ